MAKYVLRQRKGMKDVSSVERKVDELMYSEINNYSRNVFVS